MVSGTIHRIVATAELSRKIGRRNGVTLNIIQAIRRMEHGDAAKGQHKQIIETMKLAA
jgi:hypothetical protein